MASRCSRTTLAVGPAGVTAVAMAAMAVLAGVDFSDSNQTTGSLAYTGLEVGLWVLAALAVIAPGYGLVRRRHRPAD